ncbi:chromate transporter [Rivibacter subsaxonicus]|uniref:Chromate transporter n=1 Tax=Rivibacter subsaxonicus TaxID=457575 RepID=A0A4Q7W128_9BURK|nr:chromate transporter [Rivibacter subsaxonicus]RZU02911.1 chromate transporter [Rivibacter subsaxonicus]
MTALHWIGWDTWFALFSHFLLLSMLAIGGAITVAPDMHRWMVGEQQLITDAQFTSSIAIAQAAPGPNVLFVAVLGYQAGGLAGAAATLLGIMLPSTTIALAVARFGQARADWKSIRAFKLGMAPITLALMLATGWLLAASGADWRSLALTALAALAVWKTRLHLLVLIGVGGLAGALGWV